MRAIRNRPGGDPPGAPGTDTGVPCRRATGSHWMNRLECRFHGREIVSPCLDVWVRFCAAFACRVVPCGRSFDLARPRSGLDAWRVSDAGGVRSGELRDYLLRYMSQTRRGATRGVPYLTQLCVCVCAAMPVPQASTMSTRRTTGALRRDSGRREGGPRRGSGSASERGGATGERGARPPQRERTIPWRNRERSRNGQCRGRDRKETRRS